MVVLDDAPPVEDVPRPPSRLRCPFPPDRPRPHAAASPVGGVSSFHHPGAPPPASQRRVVVWVLL